MFAYIFVVIVLIDMVGLNIFAIASALQGKENWLTMGLVLLIDWGFIYLVFIKTKKPRQVNADIANRTKQTNDYTDEFGMIEWDDKDN